MSFRYFKQTSFMLATALVLNTQTVSAQNGSRAHRDKTRQQLQGGGDAGGGDAVIFVPQNAEEKEIAEAIKYAVPMGIAVINALEINLATGVIQRNKPRSEVLNISRRLFDKSRQEKRAKLMDIEYFIQKDPCLHVMNKVKIPSDASWTGSKICFSMSRLKAVVKKETMDRQIVSLTVHELTHALGESHPDPRSKAPDEIGILQKFLFDNLPEGYLRGYLTAATDEGRVSRDEFRQRFLNATAFVQGLDVNSVTFFTTMANNINDSYSISYTYGHMQLAENALFSVLTKKQLEEEMALGLLISSAEKGFTDQKYTIPADFNPVDLMTVFYSAWMTSATMNARCLHTVELFSMLDISTQDVSENMVQYKNKAQMFSALATINKRIDEHLAHYEPWVKLVNRLR